MAEKEKRIVFRVEAEKWQLFDDKRHAERTSFQNLALRLFDLWLAGNPNQGQSDGAHDENEIKVSTFRDKIHTSDAKGDEYGSEAEKPWVSALIQILQSGNDIAVRALKSNLLAFSDYVRAVPEVPDGYADIAAQARRVAALDERLVDAIQEAPVGGAAGASQTGRDASQEPVRKRVRPGRSGEKVG